MDSILLATMILLTPLTGIGAFILSETKSADLPPEDILSADQEAELALNRIWDILLRPGEKGIAVPR